MNSKFRESKACWCLLTPASGKLRQEDLEFEAGTGYPVRPEKTNSGKEKFLDLQIILLFSP